VDDKVDKKDPKQPPKSSWDKYVDWDPKEVFSTPEEVDTCFDRIKNDPNPKEQRVVSLCDESTRAFLRERAERNRPGVGRVYVLQSEDDETGWKKSDGGLWLRENWLGTRGWDLGEWQSTPELDRLRREMTDPESPDTGPVLEPREYATKAEAQNALERAERVLAKHKESLTSEPHPAIQRVRNLAKERHAQRPIQIQAENQRELARQEREDKAIEEFEKWDPPKDSRPM
jgi:hypothetical protein